MTAKRRTYAQRNLSLAWVGLPLARGFRIAAQVIIMFLVGKTQVWSGDPTLHLAQTNLFSLASTNLSLLSPIDHFRQLLTQSPAEREKLLAQKPEPQRRLILAKLAEYDAMPVQERELRLQATRLRWQLLTLMRMEPATRDQAIMLLPTEERQQIENRLSQWNLLPPAIQHVLLDFPETTNAVASPPQPASNAAPLLAPSPSRPVNLPPVGEDLAQWQTMPLAHRHKVLARFQQFFELTPAEKEKTLAVLENQQRQKVQSTVAAWQALPQSQRQQRFASLKKFADLPPTEQAQYQKLAQEWNRLKPSDRQVVQYYVDQLPPVPSDMILPTNPGFMPKPNQAASNLHPILPGVNQTNRTSP
jgi:hypothetical protein